MGELAHLNSIGWLRRVAPEQWHRTGVFPFPELNIYPAPNPHSFTPDELRLIHHVATISSQLQQMDANKFTLWTRQIPM